MAEVTIPTQISQVISISFTLLLTLRRCCNRVIEMRTRKKGRLRGKAVKKGKGRKERGGKERRAKGNGDRKAKRKNKKERRKEGKKRKRIRKREG